MSVQLAKLMNDSESMAFSSCGTAREETNMNGMKKRPHQRCVVKSVIDVVSPTTLHAGASGATAGSLMPRAPARRG
jgi:hypothetical protein